MSKALRTLTVLVSLFVFALLWVAASEDWGYEGDIGPENWGELSDDYAVCGEGQSQSPIDIAGAVQTELAGIEFHYEAAPMAIFNNGHTIEVEYHEGSYIIYNEKQYNVLQFHFHQPSEHTINGETFPMEMHIVHQNAESGQLAVVGVMLREGDVADADYADIFANLPVDVSQPDEEAETMIDAATLLPDDTETFFTYEGSLTTPPCSQIVRWLVMADPVTLTADQIAAFGEIYDGNARPVQPLNTRDLFTNAG
jgi:carbonic anhydrase